MELAAYIGSDDFWSAVIAGATTVVVGGLTLWGALYAVKPRRGLRWKTTRNVSLLHEHSSDIEVTHRGVVVAHPRVVEITLRNAGRRDVESVHFSTGNEDSLIFDFGTDIVSVLGVQNEPTTSSGPEPLVGYANPTMLHLSPALIPQRARVTYTVLVNGPKTPVKLARAVLTQTPVDADRPGHVRRLFASGT